MNYMSRIEGLKMATARSITIMKEEFMGITERRKLEK